MRLPPVLAVLAVALAACGAPPPPPVAPPPPPRPPPTRMRMSSELGEIDEAATKATFARVRPALTKCYSSGLERLEYLAGDVKFYLRVQADGHLRWVFLEESSFGDRETERCMLGVLSATQWPLPEGGEAEVHQGLGFDPPSGVRAPTDWSADRVSAGVSARSADVAACKKHGAGTFQVTAYVATDHGVGHVIAAGTTAPAAPAAADVDCVLGVVRSMKLPSPGSYPAKVSFPL